MSELPDLLYGFYGTDLVISSHNRNEDRLFGYRLAEPFHVYQTIPIHRKIRHLTPLLLEELARIQNRFVFSHASYNMIPLVTVRLCDSFDSQVVGLRRTAGKDNFPGRGCVNQPGDLLPRYVDGRFALPPKGMTPARRIAELFPKVGQHGFQYPRIHRSGRMIIHINGSLHFPYPTQIV